MRIGRGLGLMCCICLLTLSSCKHTSSCFTEVTSNVGIDFMYNFGDYSYENILESSGSGVTVFDYDGDGWIDPAVYYGNHEIELAFTRMFGGFGSGFYTAYQESYPLDPGFEERINIYNMYPSMVHVNLFGGSYLSGVERVLKKYV